MVDMDIVVDMVGNLGMDYNWVVGTQGIGKWEVVVKLVVVVVEECGVVELEGHCFEVDGCVVVVDKQVGEVVGKVVPHP